MQDVTAAWFDLWEHQLQALNDLLSMEGDSTPKEWLGAWKHLLRTWSGGVENLCGALYGGHLFGPHGTPLVAFVLDRSAETDAQAQIVPRPRNVDPATLIVTPLVSLTDHDHATLKTASVVALDSDVGLEVRVTIEPSEHPAPGDYLSLICEPKAGAPGGNPLTSSPHPPARRVLAVVLVHFI
jgi:hypothetical protein